MFGRGRSICDTSLAVLFFDTDKSWAILHQVEGKLLQSCTLQAANNGPVVGHAGRAAIGSVGDRAAQLASGQ